MADTALTLITDALLDLGVLADGEVPSASQAQGALRKLNNLLDAWGLEPLALFDTTPNVIPFAAGKQVYTIGPGGDINTPRPNQIQSAYVRDSTAAPNTLDTPIEILTDQQWQDYPLKAMTGFWPNIGVWLNYSADLISAYVTPIPTGSQYKLVLWAENPLQVQVLTQPIAFPAGYQRAITAQLAVELSPSYQVQPNPITLQIAVSGLARIKTANFQLNTLQTGGYGAYDAVDNRQYGGKC